MSDSEQSYLTGPDPADSTITDDQMTAAMHLKPYTTWPAFPNEIMIHKRTRPQGQSVIVRHARADDDLDFVDYELRFYRTQRVKWIPALQSHKFNLVGCTLRVSRKSSSSLLGGDVEVGLALLQHYKFEPLWDLSLPHIPGPDYIISALRATCSKSVNDPNWKTILFIDSFLPAIFTKDTKDELIDFKTRWVILEVYHILQPSEITDRRPEVKKLLLVFPGRASTTSFKVWPKYAL
jgi:hypothetical protein